MRSNVNVAHDGLLEPKVTTIWVWCYHVIGIKNYALYECYTMDLKRKNTVNVAYVKRGICWAFLNSLNQFIATPESFIGACGPTSFRAMTEVSQIT